MPKWLDNAVFYEIYPQSFLDTNADGIGDIQGIINKLDYIRELGFNALWINPCFLSPFGDAGYDVADYYTVAPRYGTNEDLKRLFAEAHKLGIHVLLDLVPGHTSVEHRWFRESAKPERNVYSDRYVWTDSVWEAPENMGCLRGISQRDGSCALNFFTCQPALNYGFNQRNRPWQQSPEDEGPRATLEAMMDVMRFWLGLGCDGFRVDMAASLVKNDPGNVATIALWQKVRAFLDREFPEAAMVSEWGEPEKSLRGGFHMDFLLHFGPSHYNDLFRCQEPYFSDRGLGNASAFVEKYLESREKAGKDGLICIPSGNHDMTRLAKHVQGDEKKLAFAFLLTMPGAPFIYYGDEIGMRYVEGLTSVEGGYERTGARSPMQWDGSVNAGFSAAPKEKLYIPQDPASDRPTVRAQVGDPNSLMNQVRHLIALRQAHPALQNRGGITFVSNGAPKQPLAYERSDDGEKLLVAINPFREASVFSWAGKLGDALYAFGGKACQNGEAVTLPPVSAGIYKIG
ncbi:MAG: alpha-amylase family glycosyl hydrolase [Faecousia sp.]